MPGRRGNKLADNMEGVMMPNNWLFIDVSDVSTTANIICKDRREESLLRDIGIIKDPYLKIASYTLTESHYEHRWRICEKQSSVSRRKLLPDGYK